jgi:hypothetical protein
VGSDYDMFVSSWPPTHKHTHIFLYGSRRADVAGARHRGAKEAGRTNRRRKRALENALRM